MKWLLTSDLHLSDKPRDAYRFRLFPWLAKQQKAHNVDATFILGDLTESKDRHSSKLVNQTIEGLLTLRPPVYILRGNHDGIDPGNPFFKFVNCFEGIRLVINPEELFPKVWMIPHQRTQAEFDAACSKVTPKSQIMVHQTFEGAQSETSGSRLSGLSASLIESLKPAAVWAGDVHKPQQAGLITYLGAPYHCRFGDQYTPRITLLDEGVPKNLYFECPRKWSLEIKDGDEIKNNKQLRPKDQVKLTIRLTREEVVEWAAHKQRCLAACKERGLEVFGAELEIISSNRKRIRLQNSALTPNDVLTAYCAREKLGAAIKDAGVVLLGS